MNCPRCGLINPGTAQRCDCGYDFVSKTVQESHFTATPNTALAKIAIGAQVVALVLAGAAVDTSEAGRCKTLESPRTQVRIGEP